jgi:homoserine dehydrogenase
VAILGCGTAGRQRNNGFSLDVAWTDQFEDILTSEAVVVELLGGVEPAAGWLRQLLSAGKSVVTANWVHHPDCVLAEAV